MTEILKKEIEEGAGKLYPDIFTRILPDIYNQSDVAEKEQSAYIAGATHYAEKAEKLAEALREIIKNEEKIFQVNKSEADWYNNNMPGVGQTLEYMTYPPLPNWLANANQALDEYEGEK